MIDRFKSINNFLCNIPSPLAGLALAIASLGLCWENVAIPKGTGQMFGAIAASCIIVPLLLKFLFNPHLLQQELRHPIGGSITPTITMAMMVIANYIAIYSLQLGQVISLIAILFHVYFLGVFIYHRSRDFKFTLILPSWFIPPIGLALALLMYPGGLNARVAELLLEFTLLSYALLLPIVLFRLFFCEKLANGEKPTLVILATPASLLLAAYFVTTNQPSYFLVAMLAVLSLLMTFCVYLVFMKLLRLPFTPVYSAFTFPLVVGAIALFKTRQFLLSEGFNTQWIMGTTVLANIELVIATLMVLYVSFRYLKHFSMAQAR